MKYIHTIAILFFILVTLDHPAKAEITISELIGSDDEISTLFKIISNDGNEKAEFNIKGMFPRLSPDKKHIAFIENTSTGTLKLAILDVSSGKVEYPPFIKKNVPAGWNIADLEWSNNSKKIIIIFYGPDFQPTGRPVQVLICDLSSSKNKLCYEINTQKSDPAFFLSTEWFPDDKTILIKDNLVKGSEKISVINLIENKQIVVYEGISYSASIIQNGNGILIIAHGDKITTAPKQRKSMPKSRILIYDTHTKQISDVAELPILQNFLNRYLMSKNDSTLLFLPGSTFAGKSLTVLNIKTKKIGTINFENTFYFPQAISQDGRPLLCGITDKGYEIFDVETKKFKHICSFSDKAPGGEAGWGALLLNRVDWIK